MLHARTTSVPRPGGTARAKAVSDDRLVSEERVLHAGRPMIARGLLPVSPSSLLDRQDRAITRARPRAVSRHVGRTRRRHHDGGARRCCMKNHCRWGGVACTSRDPPPGLSPGPRSPRRCDGVGVLGRDRCLDGQAERPAGWAAAVLESRHRDRADPAAPLPSPAAPGRRVSARAVRDHASRPLRSRRYDAALGAVSICGAVCGRSRPASAFISCVTVRGCPSSGQGSGRPRHTVVATGVAGGSSTVASISQV